MLATLLVLALAAPLPKPSPVPAAPQGIVCEIDDTTVKKDSPRPARGREGSPAGLVPGAKGDPSLPEQIGGGYPGINGASPVPGGGPAPAAPPLGPVVGPPLTTYDRLSWETWWRIQQDRFLNVRERVRRRHVMGAIGRSAIARNDLPPTAHSIESEVVPALMAILRDETSDDLILASLVALARVGTSSAASGTVSIEERVAVMARHLAARSQNVSETAALALGILGAPGAHGMLADLVHDTKAGAALVQRGRVPERTRSFAAYGLGLMGHTTETDVALRQRIALTLFDVIERRDVQSDVVAAAMLSIGQCTLPIRPTVPPADLARHPFVHAAVSSGGMVRALLERLAPARGDARAGAIGSTARAYCLTAVATHARNTEGRLREDALERLRLEASNRRQSTEVRSAAVLAIGELACAAASDADRQALSFLGELLDSGQPLERRLGALALAQASASAGPGDDPLALAGPAARDLHQLYRRGASQERPWGALAMGVQAFHLNRSGQALGSAPAALPARAIQQRGELLESLSKQRSADVIGAYGLGVALMHAHAKAVEREEAGRILTRAYQSVGEPRAKGHLALGLGLLGHRPGADAILEDLGESLASPVFVWHAAVAVGLIGDERLTPTLIKAMLEASSHATRSAASVALGTVGDNRAVRPLLEIIADNDHPTVSRAMAVVGLGILCEDAELPWRTPLARALPYPALTETLGGGGNALFDIP